MMPAKIAGRYLRSKKSHSAVGAIATVSVVGMAVATAAIVCVLSVFNGFRSVIGERLDTLAPDILVEPAAGKVFSNADSLARRLASLPGIEVATPTLADNALLINQGREMPVYLKGVSPEEYSRVTSIRSLIDSREGKLLANSLEHGMPETTVSIGVAQQVMAYPGDHLLLFAPRREGRVNLANPTGSFITDSVYMSGVYRALNNDYDENRMLVDISTARRLFQYTDEASALELKLAPGVAPEGMTRKIKDVLGKEFTVKDRLQQQEMNFRMIKIEKWVSFLLLGFILLIASFNVISTLSMLVLEKESSLYTLSAIGMSRRRIGSVFAWESMFVAAAGGLSGIILGVALCLIQQYTGVIKIGDGTSTIMSSYPVQLQATDILLTLVPVILIGLLTAAITARFARSRIRK